MVVASATAFVTVLLGALAAYAFSRFRFRGRRMGMLPLLLIQMFPQFLAVVAIYLILLRHRRGLPGDRPQLAHRASCSSTSAARSASTPG